MKMQGKTKYITQITWNYIITKKVNVIKVV